MKAAWRALLFCVVGVAGVLAIVATSPPPPAGFSLWVDAERVCRGEQVTLAWRASDDLTVVPDDLALVTIPADAFQPPLDGVPIGREGTRTVTALAPVHIGLDDGGWWFPVGVDASDCTALGLEHRRGVLLRAIRIDPATNEAVAALAGPVFEGSLLWRLNADLEIVSEIAFDGALADVAVDATGGLVITGSARQDEEGWLAVVAVMAPDGDIVWGDAFGTAVTHSGMDAGFAVAVAPDGDVLVAGRRAGADAVEGFVRRYDVDGELRWDHSIVTAMRVEPSGLAVGSDGRAYVAGTTEAPFAGATQAMTRDAFLRAVGPDGSEVWTVQSGGSPVGAKPDVVLAGDRPVLLGRDLIGYEADGSEAWRIVTDFDLLRPVAISGDADGGVVVASHAMMRTAFAPSQHVLRRQDVAVQRYDGAGTEAWRRAFGSLADETVYALATWPAGGPDRVVVAGRTTGSLLSPTAPPGNEFLLVVGDE